VLPLSTACFILFPFPFLKETGEGLILPENVWRARYFWPENLNPTVVRADALKELLPGNMSLPEMALRFILANTMVSTTIIGMRTFNHIQEDLRTRNGGGILNDLIVKLRAHRWDREGAPWSD
jgi:aryl-alcohol dehydrogenase-like predicted oxidoreductase